MPTTSSASAPSPLAPPPEGAPWTVMHLVRWSAGYLKGKGVPDGRLDVEVLLAETLGIDRLEIYLQFDRPVSEEELAGFKKGLLERARRKPLQYILGRTAFRELELVTDPRVLIPRPETEELVEAVLVRVSGWGRQDLQAMDVGTGSGAIALSLAREGPFRRVVATDVSEGALAVAEANAKQLGLGRVEFRLGSLLGPVAPGERFDVLVSNPPYVTAAEYQGLAPEVKHWEPREALVADDDGMEDDGMSMLRALVDDAGSVLEQGGLLALEVGPEQARPLMDRIRALPGFDRPEIVRDLAGRDRIVLARWAGEDGRGRDPRRRGERIDTGGG